MTRVLPTDDPGPTRTMREAFSDVSSRLLDEDASLALIFAAIPTSLADAARARHPDRVIDVGIREQLAVDVAAGMALTGMRVIVHTLAPFLIERAFEQIKLGFGHQGVGGVLVSIGASYDYASSGRTHQAPGDVALMSTLPGWTIHVPGHPDEFEALLRRSVPGRECAYIRTTTASNAVPRPVGRMLAVKRGRRGSVIAVGPMLDPVLAAVDGLDVTVLYATSVCPFDGATLVETLGWPDIVLVEPYAVGTSAAAVAEALADVPHRLLAIGVPRTEFRRYGTAADHARAHGLDAAGLHAAIAPFLARGAAAWRSGPARPRAERRTP